MGRDWEAFWGYMGLVTKTTPRSTKIGGRVICTLRLYRQKKLKNVMRHVKSRLDTSTIQNFKKYAYEVGIKARSDLQR